MKRYYNIGFIAILALASCQKEITVNVPEYKEKLVINSNTIVGDPFSISVGKSIGILKYNALQDLYVRNASVVLYKGNVPADTMRYDNTVGKYVSDIIAEEGQSYNVKVNAAGYSEISASTIVPADVPIAGIQRIRDVRLDIEGQKLDEIRITFNDPPAKGDYYILSITKSSSDTMNGISRSYSCVYTADASIESVYDETIDQNTCLNGDALFMRDALFNGTTKELRLYVNGSFLEPTIMFGQEVRATLVLMHVTEDFFKFRKTYQFALDNEGNPFAEPTNVHTNVKNGYGTFSVMSYDEVEIK
ncbi:hypothetical protein CAP35_10655 [Chitinophagaceae bacterium IBVUCB1]|nr:hypothetical protein CAP35_10655 [Chitinophagaceae bacterium IBVUCB1]